MANIDKITVGDTTYNIATSWNNIANKPDIPNIKSRYLHSVEISITSGNTYISRVNILSILPDKITSFDRLNTICANAKNITKHTTTLNGMPDIWYTMPAEGMPSAATSTNQYQTVFRLIFAMHPTSYQGGGRYIYVYYIANGEVRSASSKSATFTDTVTTLYGE